MAEEEILKQEEQEIKEELLQEEKPQQPKSLLQAIETAATEEDKPRGGTQTLGKILGGDILYSEQFRRQIKLILLIFVFIIIYITNRYNCQQYQIKIDKLTK